MRNKALLDHGKLRMRFASVLLFVVMVAVPCFGQDGDQKATESSKPDFSGTWELDPKNSEYIRAVPIDKGTDSNEPKRERRKSDFGYATLVIEHRDPKLRVVQKREYDTRTASELIFYSDGRGENNKDNVNGIVASKTAWDGTSLVTTFFRKSDAGDESGTIISRRTWKLSNDSRTLTIIMIGGPDAGNVHPGFSKGMVMNKKVVYQRTQG